MASSFSGADGVGTIPNNISGDGDDTPQREGMSPPPSKRRKYEGSEGGGVVADDEDLSIKPSPSRKAQEFPLKVAPASDVLDDKKPAAKQAVSLGGCSNDPKSETGGETARPSLACLPGNDNNPNQPVKRKRNNGTTDNDITQPSPLVPTWSGYLSNGGGHGSHAPPPESEVFHPSSNNEAVASVARYFASSRTSPFESTTGAVAAADPGVPAGIAPLAGGDGGGAAAGGALSPVKIYEDGNNNHEGEPPADRVPPVAAAVAVREMQRDHGGPPEREYRPCHNRRDHHQGLRFGGGEPRHADEGPGHEHRQLLDPAAVAAASVGGRREGLAAMFPPVADPAPGVVANDASVAVFAGEPEQQRQQEWDVVEGDPNQAGGGELLPVFKLERESALHLAIEDHATEAAMELIGAHGVDINFSNAKGITPLMVASQVGSLEIVRALLQKGALPNATTLRGSTALIQACHFGQLPVVEELLQHGALVDQANLKNTTAMMRASQEGHAEVVRLLLSCDAGVNRRNDERMTALMLSSQRGHVSVVRMLVAAGAHTDATTAQDSTSLMLACKRKHVAVARVLVAAGTELKRKDCKHRTVLETAVRRGHEELTEILTDEAQQTLIQADSRYLRNFAMVRAWTLLQQERAVVRLGGIDATIHDVVENMDSLLLRKACPSERALVRAMTLPAPLVELVSSYLPVPHIWGKRLALLASRSRVDPDSAVFNTLDLIDEVLEEGGILEAFDAAGITPHSSFASWSSYRSWCGKCDVILSRCAGLDAANRLAHDSDENLRQVESSPTQRRSCNYLQVMARAPRSLDLSSHPYEMSSALFERLTSCHDIQSLVRRSIGKGVHFDTHFANETLVTARMVVMWCESKPMC